MDSLTSMTLSSQQWSICIILRDHIKTLIFLGVYFDSPQNIVYFLISVLMNQICIVLLYFDFSPKHCLFSNLSVDESNMYRFADDIDGLAVYEQELVNLVERLEKASTSYGMEISAEKTKLMTNNTQGISTEVKVNGQRLETVTSFRYLGSIITDEGSKTKILARIAQATAALTRLKPLWNNRHITVSSKIRLMRSLVMSIFLYASETWTFSADLQKRIQAMEMRCFRKTLHISYKDHVTN